MTGCLFTRADDEIIDLVVRMTRLRIENLEEVDGHCLWQAKVCSDHEPGGIRFYGPRVHFRSSRAFLRGMATYGLLGPMPKGDERSLRLLLGKGYFDMFHDMACEACGK